MKYSREIELLEPENGPSGGYRDKESGLLVQPTSSDAVRHALGGPVRAAVLQQMMRCEHDLREVSMEQRGPIGVFRLECSNGCGWAVEGWFELPALRAQA